MVTKLTLKSWFSTKAGEADFGKLYQVEMPRIYNFFRYRVGDGQVAEDLTSATFEKAWRNRQRYRRDLSAFSTWLYTIARRVAIDYARKRHPEVPMDEAQHMASGALPEALVQQQEEARKLINLLSQLPDRERDLIALKYGAGLKNREIARLTGLREGNVAIILHRTRQQLREDWENTP